MKNVLIAAAVALLASVSISFGQSANNPSATRPTDSPTGDQRATSTVTPPCVRRDDTRTACRVRAIIEFPGRTVPNKELFAPWQYDPK